MTSLAGFYILYLDLYDVIGDVTDRLKLSEITFFLKQYSVPGYQNTRSQALQSHLM